MKAAPGKNVSACSVRVIPAIGLKNPSNRSLAQCGAAALQNLTHQYRLKSSKGKGKAGHA